MKICVDALNASRDPFSTSILTRIYASDSFLEVFSYISQRPKASGDPHFLVVMDSLKWDIQPRKPLRSFKLQNWYEIKADMTAPNRNYWGYDIPVWKLNTNGNFDIASVKRLLSLSTILTLPTSIPLYSRLYGKLIFQKKCKFFIWTLIHKCINMAVKLQKRFPNWYLNSKCLCSLCKNHAKDLDHLFISCPFFKDFWFRIVNLLIGNIFSNIASLCKDLCCININNKEWTITFNTLLSLYGLFGRKEITGSLRGRIEVLLRYEMTYKHYKKNGLRWQLFSFAKKFVTVIYSHSIACRVISFYDSFKKLSQYVFSWQKINVIN